MNYTELKKQTNVGWNTWNVSNVLSYSHLPEGFTINLCIEEYADNRVLRESMVGRQNIFPGVRSYDGSCTQMNLKYKRLELDVRTVVDNDEQIILLTPLKTGNYRKPTLIIEACLLWGKEGNVFKKNGRIGGECGGRTFTVHTTAPTVEAHHTYSLSPYIAVTLDAPVVVSTRPCSVAEAEALLRRGASQAEPRECRLWRSRRGLLRHEDLPCLGYHLRVRARPHLLPRLSVLVPHLGRLCPL